MFENDDAWEATLASLDADIESLSAFAGKLSDAVTIGAVPRCLHRGGPQGRAPVLLCLPKRHDEDTRDDKAQSMYARVGSKLRQDGCRPLRPARNHVLPEETLTAIVNGPVADYKFNLEDLLRSKPHHPDQG